MVDRSSFNVGAAWAAALASTVRLEDHALLDFEL